MAHTTIDDVAESITIQPGAVVSKVIYRDPRIDVTVFGFDAGEGLTEHAASRPAIVQVLAGRLRCTVDGEDTTVVPGTWLHMERGAPHAMVAEEPTTMLLTLLRSEEDPE
jgi:quercetin dioxygenase-like cupin family protein